MFDRETLHRLYVSLQARLWMNLVVGYAMPLKQAVAMTDYILSHQEDKTALDWIVAAHKTAQMQLPMKARSLHA